MKMEYDKERQQCLKNNTEDKQIIVLLEEMTYSIWFVRWDEHFWSWNTWDWLKIVTEIVQIMHGDHALKLCDISHYNRFFFKFLIYSSFPSDGHKSLGWFYIVTWNSFPSRLYSYPLCCV